MGLYVPNNSIVLRRTFSTFKSTKFIFLNSLPNSTRKCVTKCDIAYCDILFIVYINLLFCKFWFISSSVNTFISFISSIKLFNKFIIVKELFATAIKYLLSTIIFKLTKTVSIPIIYCLIDSLNNTRISI